MRFAPICRVALAGALCLGSTIHAQQPALITPPPEGDRELPLASSGQPYKLRVYAKLLQIPTIIRNEHKQTPPELSRTSVKISLDDGPTFSPTFIRVEGEDPISLAILVDASQSQPQTNEALTHALPKIVPELLHPTKDKLSLYVTDCVTFRTLPATMPDPEALASRLTRLTQVPGLHGKKLKGACANSLKLWNAAAIAIQDLGETSGRRVLLIVAQGDDAKSTFTLAQLLSFAASRGVAVFGLRDADQRESERHLGGFSVPGYGGNIVSGEDPLETLAARNGGLVYTVHPDEIPDTLTSFVNTLRSRYILEFTAPSQASRGNHSIRVTVPGLNGQVRASGSSAPLPDPAELTDPTVLPSKPSEATFGTHKPRD